MKILSVNVGLPQEIFHEGRSVGTGIFKEPVATQVRVGALNIARRFLKSRRTGCYFAVRREGELGAGDTMQFLGRGDNHVSVAGLTRLYAFEKQDLEDARRAAELRALPSSWRSYFRERVDKLTAAKEAR